MELTAEQLTEILTLPDHKIVEIQFERPDKKMLFKCGFDLTMHEEEIDGVISSVYLGNDYAVVKASDINPSMKGFMVGRIIRVVDNPPAERFVRWTVGKVDETEHSEFMARELRISDIEKELNVIWNLKDGTDKLSILIDEYLAKKQAEAELIDAEIDLGS